MPFTVSHIAAVLPIRKYTPLPFAALAVGSMSPDLPYYLPGLVWVGQWTHELWAVPTLDLFLGLSLWLWWRTATPGLRFLAPGWVRSRWQPPSWRDAPWWAVAVAVLAGALTHLGWDAFTHHDGTAVAHLTFLQQPYATPAGNVYAFTLAQHLSTVVGLTVLGWVGWRHQANSQDTVADSLTDARLRRTLIWVVSVFVVLAAALGAALRVGQAHTTDLPRMVFPIVTGAVAASAITVTLAAWAAGVVIYRQQRTSNLRDAGHRPKPRQTSEVPRS